MTIHQVKPYIGIEVKLWHKKEDWRFDTIQVLEIQSEIKVYEGKIETLNDNGDLKLTDVKFPENLSVVEMKVWDVFLLEVPKTVNNSFRGY